jgi:type III restriction enzyme
VTNLYTIVPLRAANARILIEQSIGRGLRLPYGRRVGVAAVDRLSIIAHDKFQEIVDDARKPDSAIKKLHLIELDGSDIESRTETVVSQSNMASKLGLKPAQTTDSTHLAGEEIAPAFETAAQQRVAQLAYEVIKRLEAKPKEVPTMAALETPAIQSAIMQEVAALYRPQQGELEGIVEQPDIAGIVSQTTSLMVREMIPIPRILVVPQGEVKSWFESFELDLKSLRYPAPSKDLWVHNLHTDLGEAVTVSGDGYRELRMENYVVGGLVDFDDISYDANADLLYTLATQTVNHFKSYLPEEEVWQVLHHHQKEIARFIHGQMQKHYREEISGYEVRISKGFTELKPSAYTVNYRQKNLDYRVSPADKSNMAKYLFGGFSKCLYAVQKFHSEAERVLSVILEREAIKWFKPAKGQFQIYYKSGADHPEYQPDFVAETETAIYMLEPKAKKDMEEPNVIAKMEAATRWCERASDHNAKHGGKPWRYALISHEKIKENMTIEGLVGLHVQ